MPQRVLNHLQALIACDTQNPPRAIKADDAIFAYCANVLRAAGCAIEITDLGNGCINLLATRGHTNLVFNCHLDTVPADPAWTTDPFALTADATDAIGLGACDIKGAAACLLAAAEQTDAPLAILLTSDEEAGDSDCIKHFLRHNTRFDTAIVCEPTNTKAVTTHRGIQTYQLHFVGLATHSSQPTAHDDNALHHATTWAARAIEYTHTTLPDNLRFNIGIISGGVKTNIAASAATVRFGIRQHATTDLPATIAHLMSLLPDPDRARLIECFNAPPLDAGTRGKQLVERFNLVTAEPVDFWTEAALFSAAGLTAIVLGPGDISQAHTPDESVSIEDLTKATLIYTTIINSANAAPRTQTQQAAAS